jgi:hypothetical protein
MAKGDLYAMNVCLDVQPTFTKTSPILTLTLTDHFQLRAELEEERATAKKLKLALEEVISCIVCIWCLLEYVCIYVVAISHMKSKG